ncbi:MAG: heavy metal transporter [Pseudonocardiales bacterium]|nr:heavy metal transporter [Pseudonocardiales bacterium]
MNGGEHAALALRRLGIRLVGIAAVLALLAGLGVVVFAGVSWLMSPRGAGGNCGSAPGAVPVQAAGPAKANEEQRKNAAVIVTTGRELRVPDRGIWVALATALQESGLRNLDYGDRDSLGLFQQRPSQGWGSPAQIRDPRYAATQFFQRLLQVPSWTELPLWQAAQTVQRSGFPYAYARWEQAAADLLAAVSPTAEVVAAAAQCAITAGSVAPFLGGGTGCVEDDPTTNGCVTSVTSYALTQAAAAFGGLRDGPIMRSTSCYAQRPASQNSDHPLGKGCDFFPGDLGQYANGAELERGWQAAKWFRSNAEALQLSYIIWQGRIWFPGSPDHDGWGRAYSGGGIYDPRDATGGHYDHLHVSFLR